MRNIALIVVFFFPLISPGTRGEGCLTDSIDNYSTWPDAGIIAVSPALPDTVELLAPPNEIWDIPPRVTCVWHPVKGANKYRLQCGVRKPLINPGVDSIDFVIDTIVVADTSVQLDLSRVTQYYWRVAAMTNFTGTWSEMWSFMTGPLSATFASVAPHAISGSLETRSSSVIYTVLSVSRVDLRVLTLKGELQRTLRSGFHRPGRYRIPITESKSAAGPCLLVMTAGNRREAMLLLQNGGK